jgi:hypothetical protein
VTAPRRFGPVQLANYLSLEQWQLDRAVSDGLIPGPDRSRGRWSAPMADAALAGIAVIRAAAGSIPDLGAVRAAGVLSRRLGLEVTADGVEELARRDLLPVTGSYKQHALYDGRALEAFTDTRAAAEATRTDQLRTAGQAAAYLRIRRSDLNHLTRSGVLTSVKYGHGPWDRRNEASVPLYRTGDLDQLTARPDIDWAAVRANSPRPAFPACRSRRSRSRAIRARGRGGRGGKAATVSGQDRPAHGVVQVRLSGLPGDTDALAVVLAGIPAVQILSGPDGPYPCRRQPGHRLYLTVRLTPAAHHRTGGIPMTTSAPPPRDPELAADPDYRQAAAEDWWGRVADYYADQQAEVEEEARAMAAQDAELDARQMDAQHQEALAENAAREAQTQEPEAGV